MGYKEGRSCPFGGDITWAEPGQVCRREAQNVLEPEPALAGVLEGEQGSSVAPSSD